MVLEFRKPEMSRPFWVACCVAYAVGSLALYGMIFVPEGWFDAESSAEAMAALKISTVRVSVIAFSMFLYPALLWTSLKWSKYFIISITAWALAMYIDDYLVLYKIISYPERGEIAFLLAIRPLGILSLLWMSFELTVKIAVKG
jgi:hypothetical protein